jgi:DUF4097 and DUF4098 domain-containing protein YvlB
MASTITINGVNIVSGRSISIIDGKVIVDDRDVTPENQKQIHIQVTGDIESIQADVCSQITVTGNSGTVKTSQGDIEIGGDVQGDVKTSQGNIEIGGSVSGNAKTSQGNIRVKGSINGQASTDMGQIKQIF